MCEGLLRFYRTGAQLVLETVGNNFSWYSSIEIPDFCII